jgi:hypothetical protein
VCSGYTGTGSAPSGAGTSVSFVIAAPSTLTWNWTTQYQLTTAVNPAVGTVSGAGWYDASSAAPIQATATTPGWYFGSWSGDKTGTTNPDTVTMDAAKSVTANFVTPDINLPSATASLGSLLVGAPAADTAVDVQNVGGYPLTISDVSRISGSTDFTYVSSTSPIAAATSGSVTIRYTPTVAGNVSAVFQITSDDVDETTVALTVSAFGISSNVAVIGASPILGAWTPASAPTMNDLGINGDAAAGDQIYTLQIDLTTTPSAWKVLKDKTAGWGGGAVPANDVPSGNASGVVTYYYDARDLSGTAANAYSTPWTPSTEGAGASYMTGITWVVVGGFQSEVGNGGDWDTDTTVTEMNDAGLAGDSAAGDGIFTLQVTNTAPISAQEYLIVSDTGSGWGGEIKFGSNAWNQDPGGVTQPNFTMLGVGGTIKFEFDVLKGHMRLTLDPPGSVSDWTMF